MVINEPTLQTTLYFGKKQQNDNCIVAKETMDTKAKREEKQ
jgi:hypothetical protein